MKYGFIQISRVAISPSTPYNTKVQYNFDTIQSIVLYQKKLSIVSYC